MYVCLLASILLYFCVYLPVMLANHTIGQFQAARQKTGYLHFINGFVMTRSMYNWDNQNHLETRPRNATKWFSINNITYVELEILKQQCLRSSESLIVYIGLYRQHHRCWLKGAVPRALRPPPPPRPTSHYFCRAFLFQSDQCAIVLPNKQEVTSLFVDG